MAQNLFVELEPGLVVFEIGILQVGEPDLPQPDLVGEQVHAPVAVDGNEGQVDLAHVVVGDREEVSHGAAVEVSADNEGGRIAVGVAEDGPLATLTAALGDVD